MFYARALDIFRASARPPTRTFTATASYSIQEPRLPPQHEEPEQLEYVPRWTRRQNLLRWKPKEEEGESASPQAMQDPEFLSYPPNFDSLKIGLSAPILDNPRCLAERVTELCDLGKMSEAVSLLKDAPLIAQDVASWTIVICHALKLGHYNIAYSLFTDMRKHGHNPNTHIYSVMIGGLSRIEDFHRHPEQLENARSLYNGFKRHLKFVQSFDPTSQELSLELVPYYIKVLGKAGCYREMFEVFNTLEPDGPLAADPQTYTVMLHVISSHPTKNTPKILLKNTQLLWDRAVSASQRNPKFIIDNDLAASAIGALCRGPRMDRELGFEIAHRFFGLCRPGISPVSGTLPLTSNATYITLLFCNASNRPDLCISFFDQVKQRQSHMGGAQTLGRKSIKEVLFAYRQQNLLVAGAHSLQTIEWMLHHTHKPLNDHAIQPNIFNTALLNCWFSGDWDSAARIFNLITGFRLSDSKDGTPADHPYLDQREDGRNILPTAETISILSYTTTVTRNHAQMLQCLHLVDYLGLDTLLARATDVTGQESSTFFTEHLAQGIKMMIHEILTLASDKDFPEQLNRWKNLFQKAKMVLNGVRGGANYSRPEASGLAQPPPQRQSLVGVEMPPEEEEESFLSLAEKDSELLSQSLTLEAANVEGVREEFAYFQEQYDSEPLPESPSMEAADVHRVRGLSVTGPMLLSQRLTGLCNLGKLDEAIALLQDSPLGEQNVPVWTTVIWHATKLKEFKLAYSLFNNMKKRGYSPSIRTYLTMFNGLSRIQDFREHPEQLETARSLYQDFLRYLERIRSFDPTSPELSLKPLAFYLIVLSNAKRYIEMFEVFFALEPDGPLAANPLLFTTMFRIISSYPVGDTSIILPAYTQRLWARALKASRENPNFIINNDLATYAMAALVRGPATERDIAFKIAYSFFGLCPPGASPVNGTLPLTSHATRVIFKLCLTSKSPDLCINFFNQIKRRSPDIGGVETLRRKSMRDVLLAYQKRNDPLAGAHSLRIIEWMLEQAHTGPNGSAIRPDASIFNTALLTCHFSKDWDSAARIFSLMTSSQLSDFTNDTVADHPRPSEREDMINFLPTVDTISVLTEVAMTTKNPKSMRQCLHLVNYPGLDALLTQAVAAIGQKPSTSIVGQLAQRIVDLIGLVLHSSTKEDFHNEYERWKQLLSNAKAGRDAAKDARNITTLQPAESEGNM